MSAVEMTMAETEIKECGKCGAGIREGSLFCYACGAEIIAKTPKNRASKRPKKQKKAEKISTADLTAIPKPDSFEIEAVNTDKEATSSVQTLIEQPEKIAVADAPMESAASIRRRNRKQKFTPRQVDIRWEPRAGLGISFIVGAIIFMIIAGLILAAAVYLK